MYKKINIILAIFCAICIIVSTVIWVDIMVVQNIKPSPATATVETASPDGEWSVIFYITHRDPTQNKAMRPSDNCSVQISYKHKTDRYKMNFGTTYLNTGLFFTEDNYTAVWRSNCLELTLKGQGQPPKVYRIPLNKEG